MNSYALRGSLDSKHLKLKGEAPVELRYILNFYLNAKVTKHQDRDFRRSIPISCTKKIK